MRAKHTPAIGFIFLTLLLDVLGFGLLIPVAPHLIEELQGRGEAAAASTYGWLIATFSVMLFVFAPILGSLSDRFGRRPVILISLLGSGIDFFAQALAPTLWVLFLTRAINGLSGASMTACSAYVADVTPPEKRAAGFGFVYAAFGLGFIIGPAVGGLLGSYSIRLPFFVAGGLTLVNWLYGYFVLPESLPRDRRRPFSLSRANPMGTFRHLARYPLVLELSGALFLLNLAMFILHATWVLYTAHRYHWNELQTGLSLTLVGLGAAVVQGGLTRKVVAAFGEKRVLLGSLCVVVLAYIGYALATQGWMIYAIICVASLGGLAGPAGQAIITKTVKPTEQGEVQGALTSLQSVANILGPLLGGNLFAYFISAKAPVYLPGAPYFASAILAVFGTTVAVWATRGRRAANQTDAGSDSPPRQVEA